MKKISSLSIVALLLVVFATGIVTAQTRKAGINSAAFLKVGVGARQVGMGSAVTSMNGDVTNVFWNPAGVALRDEKAQVSFTYNSWIGGLTQNAFAGSYKLEGIGTIGVGVMTFGMSGIPADRDVYPGNTVLQGLQIDQASSDTYDYMDMLAQVTYSTYVMDRLALGVSVKFINEKIDDMNASAVGFDLGSVYNIGLLNWNIGARIKRYQILRLRFPDTVDLQHGHLVDANPCWRKLGHACDRRREAAGWSAVLLHRPGIQLQQHDIPPWWLEGELQLLRAGG
jgi:hypothetical protein